MALVGHDVLGRHQPTPHGGQLHSLLVLDVEPHWNQHVGPTHSLTCTYTQGVHSRDFLYLTSAVTSRLRLAHWWLMEEAAHIHHRITRVCTACCIPFALLRTDLRQANTVSLARPASYIRASRHSINAPLRRFLHRGINSMYPAIDLPCLCAVSSVT